MEKLYTELNVAQQFIYTASNIGRAYPDFDYSDIAGIYKRDQYCLVVRTDGSEELYKKYVRFRENIDVDLDPDLRWCPRPQCMLYVRRTERN